MTNSAKSFKILICSFRDIFLGSVTPINQTLFFEGSNSFYLLFVDGHLVNILPNCFQADHWFQRHLKFLI